MKKALGQTVRDLKREVNKKVLKVPGIEQKVLDSTSNEPWGPHGSLLADIAQATKNYHEYQMIMAVIWKRINDTGKNWRHVYKALTVLEYLVANGSERVIDEIREHAYQISTLSDFQYIDSGGRDQGSNVRKKSQSLVLLVNDKERIQEVRQKAAANRDKFRNTSSTGGMYRPDRPDDDRYEGRYGSRDEDRNGYGRERDDDRYGRYGDSYGRDGDRYGRDSEERYGRDGYRDDDYRGRSRSIDEYQYGSRSRSSDRDRAYDEDGNYSSRGSGARADENSGARADENSVEGRGLERKFSEQSLGAPPSYEEAVGDARSPVHNDRDGETSAPSAPKPSSPPVSTSPSQATTGLDTSASPVNQEFDSFEFDPRGGSVPAAPAAPAAPATSNTPETDLLGALSDALAIVPTTSEADVLANSGSTFGASSFGNQSFEDPFGDSPFKAIPSTDNVPAQSQSFPPTSFQATTNQTFEPQPPITTTNTETASNFDFGDTFPGITYSSSSDPNTDILAGILPPSGSSAPITSQSPFPEPAQQPNANVVGGFGSTPPVSSYMPPQPYNGGPFQTQSGPTPLMAPPRHNNGLYGSQFGSAGPTPSQSQFGYVGPVPSQSQFGSVGPVPSQSQFGSVGPVPSQFGSAGPVPSQFGSAGPVPSQFGSAGPVPSQMAQPQQHNNDVLGNLMGSATSSPASSVGPLAIVPVQPTKEKFETKSTVWADTLSRGLVDLNISGVKTNPLADIGIDFDAINRKEKRMEKPTTAPVVSTINMGKAMGSGSGMGRAGATAIRPPANPMMAPGMGMGTGMGMGMGMGAGYGSMSQPMGGMGMGMGMGAGYGGMSQPMGGMGMNMGGMGMGMNMGMGQGHPMQPPTGMPPGPPTMQGGYNPMMGGGGGYAPQQPYGGGYR